MTERRGMAIQSAEYFINAIAEASTYTERVELARARDEAIRAEERAKWTAGYDKATPPEEEDDEDQRPKTPTLDEAWKAAKARNGWRSGSVKAPRARASQPEPAKEATDPYREIGMDQPEEAMSNVTIEAVLRVYWGPKPDEEKARAYIAAVLDHMPREAMARAIHESYRRYLTQTPNGEYISWSDWPDHAAGFALSAARAVLLPGDAT